MIRLLSVVTLSFSLMTSSGVAWAQEDAAAARALFQRGVEQFRHESFAEALGTFQESYRLNPARSVLFNMAMCLRALDRFVESVETFQQYLDESGDDINAQRRALVQRQINQLSVHLGTVRLQVVPAEAAVTIDGNTVPRETRERILLRVGEHDVVATAPGYAEARERITVAPRVVADVSLELEADAPPPVSVAPTPTPVVAPTLDQPPVTEAPGVDISEGPGEEGDTDGGSRGGVHRRWWFWTLIGTVVVAGVATGLGVGLSGDDPPPDGEIDVRLP